MIKGNYRHNTRPACGLIIVLLLHMASAGSAAAQFIDINLEIDSRISASTDQVLTFESQKVNSGQYVIDLGSSNMGVFRITALEQQLLLIGLDIPHRLQHINPLITETIPAELQMRYGYSPDEYDDSYPLAPGITHINVKPDSGYGPWRAIYIFIYGAFDTRNIQSGIYTGNITLKLEYL